MAQYAQLPDLTAAMAGMQVDLSPLQKFAQQQIAQEKELNRRAVEQQKLAQQKSQFDASHGLARDQFGLSQRAADRADEMARLQMQQMKAQIAHMAQSGATEAQMAPFKMQLLQSQASLAAAQAHAAMQKDPQREFEAQLYRRMGEQINGAQPGNAVPPPGQPQVIPQSFEQPQQADPNLQLTADGLPNAQRPAQKPDLVQVPGIGAVPRQTAEAMQFMLAKDRGAVVGKALDEDKLDKTAKGEVQKDLVGLTGTIGRLESINARLDPKFLKIPERAGFAWNTLQDKFGALPLDQKQDLANFTRFRQTSVQNAALYVKYLSGVAVSEQEYQRIMKTLPNAGTGIFDGDSPTEFQAKMKEATVQAKMAYARAKHLDTTGFKGKPWEAGVALDDMRGIIDQRGAQIEQQLQGRVPPERMRDVVRQKLKQEFGI